MKVELTLGKVLGIVAIPGAMAGAIAGWHLVGWVTPESHEHDIDTTNLNQQMKYEAITLQQQAFRDEWWCDEEGESLDELLMLQDAGDSSAFVEQEILEQRQKMERVGCDRFDKD